MELLDLKNKSEDITVTAISQKDEELLGYAFYFLVRLENNDVTNLGKTPFEAERNMLVGQVGNFRFTVHTDSLFETFTGEGYASCVGGTEKCASVPCDVVCTGGLPPMAEHIQVLLKMARGDGNFSYGQGAQSGVGGQASNIRQDEN